MSKLIQPYTDKQIRKLGVNDVREAYSKLSVDYNRIINRDVMMCPKCGNWQLTNTCFYSDKRYVTDRYPICKKCIMAMVEQREKDDDPPNETRESVQTVLKMMDRVYDDDFYSDCVKGALDEVKEKNKQSPFAVYITAVFALPQFKGLTWKDSKFGDQGEAGSDEVRLSQKTIKAAKKRFGSGYSDEEYMFLENEYQDWITRNECCTKAQEEVFENLALNKLLRKRALIAGKPIKDLDAQYQAWLDSGALKPKQNNMDAFSDAQTFGSLIQRYEETRPLPEVSPELKDVDGLGKYINVFYLGHLAKMLGIKNDYAQQYEEEIGKYTVVPPEYTEDGDVDDGIDWNNILGIQEDGK